MVVRDQIVAEHAGFLARGLDRETPQQGDQRRQIGGMLRSASLQHALDQCPD